MSLQEKAVELAEVRYEINRLQEIAKKLSSEVLAGIKEGGDQDYFKVTTSTSLKVADPKKVLSWAKKYAPQVITVNTTLARRLFAGDLKGQFGSAEKNGFAFKETEQLRPIKEGEFAETEGVIE